MHKKIPFSRQRLRKSFGRLPQIAEMPDLIEMQKQSYNQFLQKDVAADKRKQIGLQSVFEESFPIKDYAERAELRFVSYEFQEPKYDVAECQRLGISYASPLKLNLRLVIWDIDEETEQRKVRELKDQTVYMGEMPIMTDEGTFIINGTVRVVVSQMHRSPGVFFDHDKGKTHSSGKLLYEVRIIPYRGSWVDFEFDVKDLMYVRIDRKRKILISTLLLALPKAESTAEKPLYYNKQELLNRFYHNVTWKRQGDYWLIPYHAERYAGIRLIYDLVDAQNGTILVKKGKRLSSLQAKKLAQEGLKSVLLPKDALYGSYLASQIELPSRLAEKDHLIKSVREIFTTKKGQSPQVDEMIRLLVDTLAAEEKKGAKDCLISAKEFCQKIGEDNKTTFKLCTQVMHRLAHLLEQDLSDSEEQDKDDLKIRYSFSSRLLEAGHELEDDNVDYLFEHAPSVDVLDIDNVRVGPWVRNSFYADKNETAEDALLELYRVLRPGEPATVEAARDMLHSMLFDSERYDLSAVGRVKLNARLGLECPDDVRVLRDEDLFAVIETLAALRDGRGDVDDIDHLGNRRVRSVGELLENNYRQGLQPHAEGDT